MDLKYKANKTYSPETSNWNCFWHALSGDELGSQIISIFYTPTKQENSWSYGDVSSPYKVNEETGLTQWLKQTYGDIPESDVDECMEYVLEFLDDARMEYIGKPFRKITIGQ